ncbi:diphthine--ammonia ligase [Marivirga sp.]|uniref:Dph6-related ATP pyrophosphatase n=1 Tax=Marivirga sp. TaxID=2018662 RepID=UPI002D80B2F1|nr:diphthine--ammonia ligase [Marivirga sp.]HET8861431.1 diphthine--ammonia ligase [Marivirga sp.]
MKKKIAVSWSGGKDACLVLYYLIQSQDYEVDHLHTVIGEETNRVGMHGIKKELIEAQSKALNIPIKISYLPSDKSNKSYEQVMREYAEYCKSKNIDSIAFGDIFLEDLKQYREEKMGESGIKCIFPLWEKSTKNVINEFLDLGFKTKICAADASKVKKSIVGQTITKELINQLPTTVDPCGENGEFHTFVYDGSLFQTAIQISLRSIHSSFYEYEIEENGTKKNIKSEFYFAEFD